MAIESSSEREINRLATLMGPSKINANSSINVDKVKKDKSEINRRARDTFKAKPFYFNYDENGRFKN